MSTVKVNDKSYQTFPQNFATSEAAEEAAAKIACLQLNITGDSLIATIDNNSAGCENPVNAKPEHKTSIMSSDVCDTDFGEWIPPSYSTAKVPTNGSDATIQPLNNKNTV